MSAVRLVDIQQVLGGELIGSPDLLIERIGTLAAADKKTISFVSQARYRAQLSSSAAGCVIVAPELRDEAAQRGAAIVVDDHYRYYARLTRWWVARSRALPPAGRHASGWVADGSSVAPDEYIGPLAVIEPGARIGAAARIGAH